MNLRKELFVFVIVIFLVSCSQSKSEILENLVAKENGYSMHVFSNDQDFDYKVNVVHNSEEVLQYSIQNVQIHPEEEKLKWLRKLDITEDRPLILIFDSEELVFYTKEPEELRSLSKHIEDE